MSNQVNESPEDRQAANAAKMVGRNPWLALLVLCMGFFMILLDTTIVNIAIPSIIDALKSTLDQILWVLNAYILVYAVLLITASRLGDRYGQRNLFVAGLAVFTIASALCGLAQDTNQLIAGRVIQGVGGAMLTPQTLAVISVMFPPQRRGAAMGIWGAVAGVATVAGPTLGGFLVTNIDWRWIFYVNLPVGIAAIVLSFLFIPDLRPGRQHGWDVPGILLSTASLFLLVFGLIEGQRFNWGTVTGFISIPLILVAGIVLLVLFLAVEQRASEPLVPLALFRNRNFAILNWVSGAMAFGMLGLFLPLTIYLQSVVGLTAFQAGLAFAPMSLTSMVVAPNAGRLTDRIGGKYILLTGLALFGIGMAGIDFSAGLDSTWLTFLPWLIVAGFGMGCIFAPATTVAMRNIPQHLVGAASGVFNTTRQLGGAIGSSIVGAVLQNRLSAALNHEAAARAGQLPSQLPATAKQKIVSSFSSSGQGGLEVGRGQTGAGSSAVQLPPNIPASVAHQVQQQVAAYFHDVFVNAYMTAMRPTLLISVAVVLLAAISCLGIQRRKAASAAAEQELERGRAAAG
ncbi:MAG: DHA2 family efflux MFS transporter permease subunit [Candidatus Dormibacteraeota bacterium]|nr:DHA2 family efflux MFS transporter permease subunit [Candidatus Dormibacteraeota bacterium]